MNISWPYLRIWIYIGFTYEDKGPTNLDLSLSVVVEDHDPDELEEDDHERDSGEDVDGAGVGHGRGGVEGVHDAVHAEGDEGNQHQQNSREEFREHYNFAHGSHDDQEDAGDVPLHDVAVHHSVQLEGNLYTTVHSWYRGVKECTLINLVKVLFKYD